MNNVRFGLIGHGAWGSHHGRAIAKTPGAELTAITARSEESRQATQTAHPTARVYNDHRAMLDMESLDVVDVVLPSHLHFTVARDVLASRRHLLLEKPMALTLEHCDELISLADANHLHLAVGHELRHSSLWGKAQGMIASGAIGAPLHLLIELWRRPYRLGSGGWRHDIERVGNWIDLCGHC